MSLKGGVHLICSQTSFCNKTTTVQFVAVLSPYAAGCYQFQQSIQVLQGMPGTPGLWPNHSPCLDQRKEKQGLFITHRKALDAGVGITIAGRALSGPPMQSLWDQAANQSLQHTTAYL